MVSCSFLKKCLASMEAFAGSSHSFGGAALGQLFPFFGGYGFTSVSRLAAGSEWEPGEKVLTGAPLTCSHRHSQWNVAPLRLAASPVARTRGSKCRMCMSGLVNEGSPRLCPQVPDGATGTAPLVGYFVFDNGWILTF